MESYAVRDEFLSTRNKIFGRLFSVSKQSFDDTVQILTVDEDWNILARYQGINEQIVYLTTKAFLFGTSNLFEWSNRCMERVEQLISKYQLDLDRLDPVAVANYLQFKAIKVTGSIWKSFEIKQSMNYLQQSVSYMDKSGLDDRQVFLRYFLGSSLYLLGKFAEAIAIFEQAQQILDDSTQITVDRKHNLRIRIKGYLLAGRAKVLGAETQLEFADQLIQEYETVSNHILYFNNMSFVLVIDYLLSIGRIDQAKVVNQKMEEVFLEVEQKTSELSLPGIWRIEKVPVKTYIVSQTIDMEDPNFDAKWSAFETLNQLLDHPYTTTNFKSIILIHQLRFLLKVFKGFKQQQYYQQFCDKAEELIQFGRRHQSLVDLLTGIILYSQIIAIHDGKLTAIEYLYGKKEEFTEEELELVDSYINKQIAELEDISSERDQQQQLEAFMIEKYIQRANEMIWE